jgi:23S rRNA pseudouridine1911/1915/1917 synthase
MASERGEINRAIGRHPSDRKRMSSLRVSGKSREATTQWLVERRYAMPMTARALAWYCLIRLMPRTGRTHQIRVHLADMGFPLVGDRVYGRHRAVATADVLIGASVDRFARHALHAEKLSFDHVRSGERLEFHAPLADDMVCLLNELRSHAVAGTGERENFASRGVDKIRSLK